MLKAYSDEYLQNRCLLRFLSGVAGGVTPKKCPKGIKNVAKRTSTINCIVKQS